LKNQEQKDFYRELRAIVRRVKSQTAVSNTGLAAILSSPGNEVSKQTVSNFLERGVQPRGWLLNRIIWWLSLHNVEVAITETKHDGKEAV